MRKKNRPRMFQELYRKGSPSSAAFVVPSGQIRVSFGEDCRYEISCPQAIIGITELLLNPEQPSPRLFDIDVTDLKKVSFLSVDSALKGFSDYSFGLQANIFLSHLMDVTNKARLDLQKQLSRDYHLYQKYATAYYGMVRDLLAIKDEEWLQGITEQLNNFASTEIYAEGRVLTRRSMLRSLIPSNNEIEEFVQVFPKNSIICTEGQTGDSLFVLLEGRVLVTREHRYLATIEEPGVGFGEVALFLESRRTATLEALEDTKVYVVKADNLQKFHSRHRDMFRNIAGTLSERISESCSRINWLIERKVEARQLGDLFSGSSYILELEGSNELKKLTDVVREYLSWFPNARAERILLTYRVI